MICSLFFFFQAEDGIRDVAVTGVQTCALPIYLRRVLRAPAVAADLQAAADGVGVRPLFPARALLPRRRPALRPATRVYADRPRSVVRGSGGRPGLRGGGPDGVMGRSRARRRAAIPPDHLAGVDGALRHR